MLSSFSTFVSLRPNPYGWVFKMYGPCSFYRCTSGSEKGLKIFSDHSRYYLSSTENCMDHTHLFQFAVQIREFNVLQVVQLVDLLLDLRWSSPWVSPRYPDFPLHQKTILVLIWPDYNCLIVIFFPIIRAHSFFHHHCSC